MSRELTELAGRLSGRRSGVSVRLGVVSSTSPLAVKLGGAATAISGVKRLSSYTPVTNHTVLCLVDGPDVVVLGALA